MIPQHSSESNEFYTPKWLVDGALHVFGGPPDLDPASSVIANQLSGAKRIHTAEDNGLWQDWSWAKSIFLNPPGGLVDEKCRTVIRGSKALGRTACTETGSCGLPPGHKHKGVTSSAAMWWHKLGWWWNGSVHRVPEARAVFVLFSLELLQTTQKFRDVPHPHDFASCLPEDRIDFDKIVGSSREPGGQPTHANLIVLLSNERDVARKFRDTFSPWGKILIPGSL